MDVKLAVHADSQGLTALQVRRQDKAGQWVWVWVKNETDYGTLSDSEKSQVRQLLDM